MNTRKTYKIILFDGHCNLCVRSIQFIIKRDINNVFKFASIQADVGKKIIRQNNIDVSQNESIIVITGNDIKYRSSAVLYILYYLKTIWKFLIILYLIPSPIRDLGYKLIAINRYMFFGKKEKCMLPDDNIKSKFLSL